MADTIEDAENFYRSSSRLPSDPRRADSGYHGDSSRSSIISGEPTVPAMFPHPAQATFSRPAPAMFSTDVGVNASDATAILDSNCPSFNTSFVVSAITHARRLVRIKGLTKRRLQRSLHRRWNGWLAHDVDRAKDACVAAKLRYEQLRDAYIHMSVAPSYIPWNAWEFDMWEREQRLVERDVRDASGDESSDEDDGHVDFHHKLRRIEDNERSMDAWRYNRGETEREETMARYNKGPTKEPRASVIGISSGSATEAGVQDPSPSMAGAMEEVNTNNILGWARILPRTMSTVFRSQK